MNTRTAVITGAAGGLGQATARQLLAAGFDVVAVTRDARSAKATRQTLTADARGRTVYALHADLVDLEQHRIAVAVQPNRVHVLRVARRLALDPVLLP